MSPTKRQQRILARAKKKEEVSSQDEATAQEEVASIKDPLKPPGPGVPWPHKS